MKKISFVLFVMLLTGCGMDATMNANSGSTPNPAVSPAPIPAVASVKPADVPSSPAEGLEAIQEKLNAQWRELRNRHSIQMLSTHSSKSAIGIEIRSYGDFERILTKEEIEGFKESLFELVGERFPLDVSIRECCSGEPLVTGKIKEVDQEKNRILIVNEHEKNGNTDDPVAYWVSLTEDGKVIVGGEEPSNAIEPSLVGKEAQAWTTGMVDQSYPGQTAALKIVAE
ncbi:hypothetical protein [Cohnella herbarum]|uniref:Uncharacterized protein n=1 Tax=Cohnella herbarum TaxID=2728023 RepID=A0A7Z2ZM11_9BACL|nr:hypothetical protein [Cohnella herbarum]QJD84861.1 hypothetical protein HH215_17855 [Cohnella herbarum]